MRIYAYRYNVPEALHIVLPVLQPVAFVVCFHFLLFVQLIDHYIIVVDCLLLPWECYDNTS